MRMLTTLVLLLFASSAPAQPDQDAGQLYHFLSQAIQDSSYGNIAITGGSIANVVIANSLGGFVTLNTTPASKVSALGANATNTGISINASGGTANYAIDVVAGDIRAGGNIYTVGGAITSDALLTASNGLTVASGTSAFGANPVTGSSFTITGGSVDGTTVGVVTPASGSFTTLRSTGASDIGTGASLTNNFGTGTSIAIANGGTGQSVATAATTGTTGTMTVTMTSHIVTITPTGACTFNASGGLTGQIVTFLVTTSGTTSFTLTWNTNFKSTATLATGTTTAKKFCVTFLCIDGTTWCEIARTTAE